MKQLLLIFCCITAIVSCTDNKTSPVDEVVTKQPEAVKKYIQVNFKIALNTPTVGITNYTLITNDLQRDSANAREIIKAKVILPLAMQGHDGKLFDSVLAKNFISQGEDEFFDRNEYIQDRVNGKWTITDVRYENLVLQFFGDLGILTYRNKVTEKDEFGKVSLFLWFWTDVWVKENGRWKIRDLRAIN
ncbi:MAG: nuclear transport factor 2 family protein [Ferruginibacter sp.]